MHKPWFVHADTHLGYLRLINSEPDYYVKSVILVYRGVAQW